MIHSFYLNPAEETRFQEILAIEGAKSSATGIKVKTESAVVRDRIFRRRGKVLQSIGTTDVVFLSTMSNLISSLKANYSRGESFVSELSELEQAITERLNGL